MRERQDDARERQNGNGEVTSDDPHTDTGPVNVHEEDDDSAPRSGPRHASRRAAAARSRASSGRRPRSVRAKIVTVLMVPVMSLMALWGFATVTTAQNVSELQQLKEVNDTLLTPINDFVAAVQNERVAASEYMAAPDAEPDALLAAGEATDAAVAALRDGIANSSTDAAGLDPRLPGRIEGLVAAADSLSGIRDRVAEQSTSWLAMFDAYTATVSEAFGVTGVLTQMDAPGVEFDPRVVLELSMAREMISREDAVMSAAYAAEVMTQSQYLTLVEAAQAGQSMLWTDIDDPRPSAEAAYRDVLTSRSYQFLRDLEADLTSGRAGYTIVGAVPADAWSEAAGSVQQELAAGEARVTTIAAEEASLFSFDVLGTTGVAVVLGLIGVILSLLISVLIGRGLVVELAGLHNSAMDLARRKLPATLRKLNSGENVDIDTEAPQVALGDDEVSQVAEALNAVHRSAVQAAIERSDVLKGISGVYVYLARRSQVLLHRQLALLDSMERRIEDPDQLEDLFRLDHLTTRMRRQAESLIILSGVPPARRWRNPVPMMDVVRGAVAEVEDFTRVEVANIPDVRISGTAVADLTHLIAELVENAVVFSPPHTKAVVRGEVVGTGLALEVEDRGLGMSQQAMADANRRIRDTDQVDLLEADQLGLFVVNRLSRRHNVEVTLQRSAYGGVTAIVLIPDALLDRTMTEQIPPPEPAPDLERAQLTAVGSLSAVPDPRSGPATEPGLQAVRETAKALTGQTSREDAAPQDAEVDDLPRRVRRASLRPELRSDPPPPPPSTPSPSENPTRTPDQARATLSALRNGWLRGQSEKQDESPQEGENR
ncbi:sensor histidine kinase [Phytoactinopolyspora mesophila]|uniref:histidine kinase n=1 Tax=Phytoactinopolyspora mesophila TaxID=2650750 RepID=A0A7K3M3N3_9ACTN|nr:nitrate- and nitrite sensing domain-containing protein [Phytoactinopolyspora mesophila]NDL57522.1 HAMP domain-containing protein [Phytoactinopolyspora mesophila]